MFVRCEYQQTVWPHFWWERGYYRVDLPETTEMSPLADLLMDLDVGLRGEAPREYEVFSTETGLFKNLAEVPETNEGVLVFASQYGNLGLPEPCWSAVLDDGMGAQWPDESSAAPDAEPFDLWLFVIRSMRASVQLWETIRSGDANALEDTIWIDGHGDVQVDDKFAAARVMDESPSIDVEDYAMEWLTFQVSLRLSFLRPLLYPKSVASLHGKNQDQPALVLRVASLRDAMWLQLAAAIAEDKKYNRCQVCRKWFEIAPETNRRHRQFCSETHRNKAYRYRQRKAKQLHAQGKTVQEIAAELNSDEAAVQNWVKK